MMRCFRNLAAFGLCAAGMGVAFPAEAGESDMTFTYQGRLMQGDSAATGPVFLSFRLYDDEMAGTQIGVQNNFPGFDDFQAGGIFTLELNYGASAFDGGERWLEIDVNGVTLTPRQPLRATPYAIRALQGGDEGESVWELNGTSAAYTGGRVGIGTTTPGAPLEVVSGAGRTRIGADVGNIRTRLSFFDSDNNDSFIEKTDGGRLRFRVGGTNTRMTIAADGNVGIGTQVPQSRLSVIGDVTAHAHTATQNLGSVNVPTVGTQYADNVIVAWARVLGNGIIDDSFGVSNVLKLGPGSYEVQFNQAYSNPLVGTVTAMSSGDPVLTTTLVSTSFATVRTFEQVNQGGQIFFTAGDRPFYIIVTGRGSN